eukprot:CAMPEP_0201543322 /NCGR_PEP_ID=MMETSP0161_2-20130828/72535_1 /ASSEMBLY_ACC=CAM_ASM_000251 /TAXON_ID=180227 /ORGANISM="Neoparamoeba aestuarina, Strain SoJaBio B1-5/56/2" /LENGTH=97 /DNA_ID=CAMNT_0047951091 /DNA_START=1282 /DNA_END=1575 /DNA_ORIENTATION=-
MACFPTVVIDMAKRKAEELEDFGKKAEIPQKRRKTGKEEDTSVQEAEEEIKSFLQNIASIPIDDLPKDKAIAQAQSMRRALEKSRNPHVQRLLKDSL